MDHNAARMNAECKTHQPLRVLRRAACALALSFVAIAHGPAIAFDGKTLASAVEDEEERLGGRVGVAVLDTKDGTRWSHRGGEIFPLNSTHKAFTCAAFLNKIDRSELALKQTISIAPSSLVTYSPVMEKHVAPEAIALQDVCAAAVSYSDNTAANAITDVIGGPSALTAFMRSIGDPVTRLDRREPALNESRPNDERDATTPDAVVASLHKLVLGDVLSAQSRALLTEWMVQDKVADALLRSAMPKTWVIADKSGAGGHGSRSIVAVIWPGTRAPVVIGVYITQTEASMAERDAAIARIGTSLVRALQR